MPIRLSKSWLIVFGCLVVLAFVGVNPGHSATKPLDFSFTTSPKSSEIHPPNIVSFTIRVINQSHKNWTAALIFPNWVDVKWSSRPMYTGKVGESIWYIKNIEPGKPQTLTVKIRVTTAWDESNCPMGDWHFGAELYTPDAYGHLTAKHEVCYGPPR